MPASGWNAPNTWESAMAVSQGSISYASALGDNVPRLANALLAGYAASSTDTGHRGGATDAQWALGHPEKIVDYGYRAIHETAEKSKAIISAFYGDRPEHSYFNSCSNGGREALMEAQRFPADYDGIIAGAPANSFTHMLVGFIMNAEATEADPASYIPAAKLPALESAVLAACDALDGLKDGVIDDPRKCHFDPAPATLLCQGAESRALHLHIAAGRGSQEESTWESARPTAGNRSILATSLAGKRARVVGRRGLPAVVQGRDLSMRMPHRVAHISSSRILRGTTVLSTSTATPKSPTIRWDNGSTQSTPT